MYDAAISPSRFEVGARQRLFFMHIPKTAGTSMRLFLQNQYHQDVICPATGWHNLTLDNIRSYHLVRGHFQMSLFQALEPETKILTLLRDPVARTVSVLRHLQRDPNFHALHDIAKHLTLPQMLRNSEIMRQQRNAQAAYLCAAAEPAHVLARPPGRDPGFLEPPTSLSLALERLHKIDFLGRVEDLASAVEEISEEMNFHPPVYFPFVNSAPRRRSDTQQDLSQEDIEIIRAHNEIDLQLYAAAETLITQRRFERAMRRLLARGFYRPPEGSFEIALGGIIPGSGYYDAESHNGVSWRWTGPDRCFSLELPLRADADYECQVQLMARPGADLALTATVNGAVAALRFDAQDNQYRATLDISRAVLGGGGLCRIVFDSQTTGPSAKNPEDIRPLGVLVNRISFKCR